MERGPSVKSNQCHCLGKKEKNEEEDCRSVYEVRAKNLHDSRRDCIDSDSLGCLLLRQTPGEGCDCAFGRCVVEECGIRHVCSDTCAIDNAVATLHVLERVLAHCEHGNDVCLESLFCDIKIDFGNVGNHFLHCGCFSFSAVSSIFFGKLLNA